jgi:tetratricopeptide (TPR) repeat protein
VTRRGRDGDALRAGGGPSGPDRGQRPSGSAPPSRPPAWVRVDGARDEWEDATPRGTGGKARAAPAGPARGGAAAGDRVEPRSSARAAIAALSARHTLPPEIAADIRKAADVATTLHRERLVERAESAYGAYERGRYQDALRAIKPVADEAPGVAAVRELAGFAAYRSGKWREAARHLQAFGDLSDSSEHLPVLMDCQRALRKPKKVAELWGELRQSSPDADVLAEGRIVAAASLADAGDLNGAIAMLATAGASKALRNPSDRHVRQWYLLADLYERAGDLPKAREYFERVRRADPEAYDVAERLRGLGPERRARSAGSRKVAARRAPKPARRAAEGT